jgi:hypothetical protein
VDSGAARQIFTDYATAMAYIEVELPNGDVSMGSAFHVGDGVFVTARHVVEGNRIAEAGSTNKLMFVSKMRRSRQLEYSSETKTADTRHMKCATG